MVCVKSWCSCWCCATRSAWWWRTWAQVDLTSVQWAKHYPKTFCDDASESGVPAVCRNRTIFIWSENRWFRHLARRSVTIASHCDDVTMPRCCDNRFTSMLSFKIVFFEFFLFILNRFEINSNLNRSNLSKNLLAHSLKQKSIKLSALTCICDILCQLNSEHFIFDITRSDR